MPPALIFALTLTAFTNNLKEKPWSTTTQDLELQGRDPWRSSWPAVVTQAQIKQRDPEPKITTGHAAKSKSSKEWSHHLWVERQPSTDRSTHCYWDLQQSLDVKAEYIRETKKPKKTPKKQKTTHQKNQPINKKTNKKHKPENLFAISHPLNSYWNSMLKPDSWNSADDSKH